jgi:hypothetical protein
MKFSPDQITAIDGICDKFLNAALTQHAVAVLTGSAGTGKEQPINTPIQTMAGEISIGKLQVGDNILGTNGKNTKVTGVFPQGHKEVYKIIFRDKSSTLCGLNHIWSIKTSRGNWINKTTKELLQAGLQRKDTSYKFQIPLTNPIQYPKKILPISPYLLGLLIADGALTGTTIYVSSHALDTSYYLKTLNKLLPKDTKIGTTRNTSINGHQTSIIGTSLRNKLQILKLNKSSKLRFIPKNYLRGNTAQRVALLQGLMDADGHTKQNNSTTYATSSPYLRDTIIRLVQSLGGTAIPSSNKRLGKNTEYEINIKVKFNPYTLPRKTKRWKYSTKNPPSRYIVDIQKCHYREESVCITVAAKNSLYLTSEFIVTHNTTVVSEILRKLASITDAPIVELSATTHRAASVLQDAVGQQVGTVHSLFKIKPGIDRYGKELLKSTGLCEMQPGSIVIIDESSMLGNLLVSTIVDTIKRLALKVLFVGDPYQLPPPKDECMIFDGSLPTFTLTQVHRQLGDNPILDKAIEFREYIEGVRTEMPNITTALNSKGHGIHVLPHHEFVSQFVKKYVDYNAGAEVDIPLCTYTNESAINYNKMIRKAAYFLENTIRPFYRGERLIANSVVMLGDQIVLTNNEIVYIMSYTEIEQSGIPGYSVIVRGNYSRVTKSNRKTVFVPKSKAAANKVTDELKKRAKKNRQDWPKYYAVLNSIADLRPPFAGTTHKVQGGTYPAVFIDRTNIAQCHDDSTRARLMYVALTRASNNVYINT